MLMRKVSVEDSENHDSHTICRTCEKLAKLIRKLTVKNVASLRIERRPKSEWL